MSDNHTIPNAWAMRPDNLQAALARIRAYHDYADDPEKPEPVVTLIDPGQVAALSDSDPQAASLGVKRVSGSIAVIPVQGVIAQKAGWFADTSTEWVGRALDDAIANQSVGAIVLNIDSPGGTVFGTPELADKIFEARAVKPVYGLANSEAASAAYWIGSQTERLFVTPSGQVGSIGVWSAHIDQSQYLEDFGLKVTLISAGKYKVEGNSFEPLSEEARAAWQTEIDAYYDQFLAAVGRGRGVKAAVVKRGFGEGRMVMAPDAIEAGMADGIATMPQLLGALVKAKPAGSKAATARAAIAIAEAE
jgi:signal peptide peptidase SppA